MNVFVLCTGRSGSTSFIKACKHITNYSAAHESLTDKLSHKRFDFPQNHIEADNRLSWQLGQLDKKYGNEAYYVHLKRDKIAVAKSYTKRFLLPKSMIYAYANGIKQLPPETLNKKERYEICLDYVETLNSNIEFFLKDKPKKITIELSEIKSEFETFWNDIKSEGDFNKALAEFDVKHNKRTSKKIFWRYSLKHLAKKFVLVLKEIF